MTTNEILTKFNKEGIFPTDEQLQIVIDETGANKNIYELEMDLLELASRDESHPYHPMTQPNTEMGEAEKQLLAWFDEVNK